LSLPVRHHNASTSWRIGRIRFLVEFVLAGALTTAGGQYSSDAATAVVVIGSCWAIWASIRRLSDIKRSVWWASILAAPFIIGSILGLVFGQADIATLLLGVYIVAYVIFLVILSLLPSADETAEG